MPALDFSTLTAESETIIGAMSAEERRWNSEISRLWHEAEYRKYLEWERRRKLVTTTTYAIAEWGSDAVIP